MSTSHISDRRRSWRALFGVVALLCLPLLEAVHPFLYYANHARRGYGRNIQPLPCATKEGDTGVCMFAWDCMKAEGSHLGTCIERFYFGSCCKLKPGSKKPEHTVMKTDVYVLATTSPPQTATPDAASSSAPQTSSNLLGMITGQTTLHSESFDTSTSRTTLLHSSNVEDSFSGVQEVQQVFIAGAQSASSVDLDMEAIEQQMVEESSPQEKGGEENGETNQIQVNGDSQPENGDQVLVNGERTQVTGDETMSDQTFDATLGESTTAEQSLKESVQPHTDEPTLSTVEEGSLITEESQVTANQAEGQSDQNQQTSGENQITSIQELGEASIISEQNEIEGGQQSAVIDNELSGQDVVPQVSDTDQNTDNVTPEIPSEVLEAESESNQESESQIIGVGIGTVTSVEIDYAFSATEAYIGQSEESQGQTISENEINSEHTVDDTSDSSSVTSVIQGTTVNQTSEHDSTSVSNSSENEVGGAESPMVSSTAADSSTSATSDGEQTGSSEVTESSNQTTDTEVSETVPTTEAIPFTTDENDVSTFSSERTESELAVEQSESETTLATVAVSEKPLSQDEHEIASQPSGSSESTESPEVSDDNNSLAEDITTVTPQQTDSTVLPEPSDSQSLSDSASIDISAGESGENPSTVESLVADSVKEVPGGEATVSPSGGEGAEGDDDALAVVTGTTSEISSSSGDDSGALEGSTTVDVNTADKDDAASNSESEVSGVSTGNDPGASTTNSGASIGTTVSSDDLKTPDDDVSQSESSTESGIKGDEHTLAETDITNNEIPTTVAPSNVSEHGTGISLPSLGENVIVPGVQIVSVPETVKNESVAGSYPVGSFEEEVSPGDSVDSTTEIPQESIPTEVASTVSASEEVSSTDKSPVEEIVNPESSSSEVSKPDESGAVVGIGALLPNKTVQPEQQFETQEEQLLHRLKTSSFKEICGQPVYPSRRIVGGSQASFGEWPWQVSLRQWRSVTYLHKCGAALVNENWAITAAHCVENVLPDQLLLRLGEFDLERADEPYGHMERKVQIIATHPQFDPRTFEYDLALLRFNEPVTFQPNIIPICIPEDDYDFIGDTGFVSGWGRLYEDGPLPSLMQKVPVPVITNGECEVMYRNAGYIEDIPNIFICAGYEGGKRDSCEGDSGGPLVIQHQNSWKLAGVISWGIGCALPNQPGVYTRISAFREWINKIIVF
ncbi:Serine proteases trypsin domain [Trinorchestia longiramus]|nr:Serine proteases trypsin domain [Trinorchestia longiramus]